MQTTVICNYCGAESFSEARFCRQCGKEFSEKIPGSVTENTTRLLETPPMTSDPFANMNGWTSAPIDKPNTNPISMPTGKETQFLTTAPQSKSNTGLILGGVAGLIVIIVIMCAATLLFWRTTSSHIPVTPSQPQVPTAPPQVPQKPPVPPTQPSTGTTDLTALKYPGAEVKMSFGNGGMMLSTNDSAEKVAKWYSEKLNKPPDVKSGDAIIFSYGKTTGIVITKSDDGTQIIIGKDNDSQ